MTARDKEEQRKQAVLEYGLDRNAGWDQILGAQLKAIAEERNNPNAESPAQTQARYRAETAVALGLHDHAGWQDIAARVSRHNHKAAEQAAFNEFETIMTRSTDGRQTSIAELDRIVALPAKVTPEAGFLRNLRRNLKTLDPELSL